MKVTQLTKDALSSRRQGRALLARGYEYVGEGGGRLWELERGFRIGWVIKDAIIAVHGKGVYVKIVPGERLMAARPNTQRPLFPDEQPQVSP